jgi:predicted PurR-regulated permease PerM
MSVTSNTRWFWLVVGAGSGLLIYLLAPVLTPFMVSAILAYLGDPLVDRLQARGYARGSSVLLVFLSMLLLGVLAILIGLPLLGGQFHALLDTLPAVLEWGQREALPALLHWVGGEAVELDRSALRNLVTSHWEEVGGAMGMLLGRISDSGQVLMTALAYLTLVPVVTFYLLRDWDVLIAAIHDLLPRAIEPRVAQLAQEIDDVLAQFLRGQFLVMLVLAVLYSLGLLLCGLKLALIVGTLAGLVSFVPYLGLVVGVALAGIAAVAQFHDLSHLLLVVGVFALVQTLESIWLSPWLVGDRIGLHPVAVIFAVMAGGQLFGFFGVLLALPVAAIVVVLLRHSHDAYRASPLYGA